MYRIGDVVTLTLDCLGNSPGTRGVVFNRYPDFDDMNKMGVQIIFENGEYDGFSYEDQQVFLKREDVQYIPFSIREYKFENVTKMSLQFKNGYWDEIFR